MMLRKRGESAARLKINVMLQAAGWKLPPEQQANVELEGDFRSDSIKRAIGGKRPDYHLYADDQSALPLAFVEAKRDRKTIAQGLEQGRSRVNRILSQIPDFNMLLFVTDGVITVGEHSNGHPLRISGSDIDDIPNLEVVQALIDNPDLLDSDALVNADQLVRLFIKSSNNFRQDGLDAGTESLLEFSKLLFLKIMAERDDSKGKTARTQWHELRKARGKNAVDVYRRATKEWVNEYGEIFLEARIRKPHTIEELVVQLDGINFSNTSIDIKGNAYEWFLSRYSGANTSDLGQYFTPRHIARMMAKLIKPMPNEKIYDPFAGTGGMLIGCYEQISRNLMPPSESNHSEWKNLWENTLFGGEITRNASALAKMNMIIVGDGHANITMCDSLENPQRGKYDALITNIPFNMKPPAASSVEKYRNLWRDSDKMDANSICVTHCIDAVREGGRIAMIVPDSVLAANKYEYLRQFIANSGRIRGVIKLPQGLFNPYTSAKTAIVVMDKLHQQKTREVSIIKTIRDGYTLETNRQPTNDNQIPEIVEAFLYNKIDIISEKVNSGGGGGGYLNEQCRCIL